MEGVGDLLGQGRWKVAPPGGQTSRFALQGASSKHILVQRVVVVVVDVRQSDCFGLALRCFLKHWITQRAS